MNRNQRIVVSIVGIIIVTLALIGITYAYFMTKIIGNSTSTSISGTLANLELTYGDGNDLIATSEMMPGDTLEKTFLLQNTGTVDVDNYIVVLENVTNTLTRKGDLVYTLTCESNDNNPCIGVTNVIFPDDNGPIIYNSIEKGVTHSYTLTVTYKNYDDIDQSVDMGASFSAKVNIKDGKSLTAPIKTMVLLNSNTSRNGTTYRTTPETTPAAEISAYSDQFVEKDFGEFSFTPENYNLAYADSYSTRNSVKNSTERSQYYILTNSQTDNYDSVYYKLEGKYITFHHNWYSTSEIFEVINATRSNLTLKRHVVVEKSKESTLSKIEDLYGTSYYYRGDVTDNYLTFNNMCWKIVRIQGDGSTKIILQDPTASCSEKTNEEYPFIGEGTYGHYGNGEYLGSDAYAPAKVDYLNCATDSSTCIEKKLNSWFDSKFTRVKNKLKEETWYLGDTTNTYKDISVNYYESGLRLAQYNKNLRKPSLLSQGNPFESYIAPITADEAALAGTASYEAYTSVNHNYYLYVPNRSYFTLSPMLQANGVDKTFKVDSDGSLYINYLDSSNNIRPVLVLNSNVEVSGQGTKSDPYIVK